MERAELFVIYEKVWRATEAAGARVAYWGMGNRGGEAGWFDPHFDKETGEAEPEVAVFRPYFVATTIPSLERRPGSPLPPPDIEAELYTLAHEAGHFHSFLSRGEAWRTYHSAAIARDQVIAGVAPGPDFPVRARTAVAAQLAESQRLLIVDEEQFAWDFGRGVLRDKGLLDFARFDESARLGVHFHRYRLGLDELWPSDLPAGDGG